MLRLIQNELYKLFHSKKIYVFGFIITAIAVIASIALKKNPPEVISINLIASYMLMANMQGIMVIFGVIVVSDMITDEYRSGTLKLPMIHPQTRIQYFGAKVISVAIITVLTLMFTMVISYLLNLIVLGTGGSIDMGEVLKVIRAYLLSALPLLAFNMVVFFIAINLSSPGAVIGLSLGLYFGLQIAGQILHDITKYLITSYFTLFLDKTTNSDLIEGLIIIGLYFIVFYLGSTILFKRKDILE